MTWRDEPERRSRVYKEAPGFRGAPRDVAGRIWLALRGGLVRLRGSAQHSAGGAALRAVPDVERPARAGGHGARHGAAGPAAPAHPPGPRPRYQWVCGVWRGRCGRRGQRCDVAGACTGVYGCGDRRDATGAGPVAGQGQRGSAGGRAAGGAAAERGGRLRGRRHAARVVGAALRPRRRRGVPAPGRGAHDNTHSTDVASTKTESVRLYKHSPSR
jgi:hypothetical protein